MKSFFRTVERQENLWTAATPWEGTPFAPGNASLGHGAGCVELVHEILSAPELGAIPRLDPLPAYTLDHGHHATESQLLRWLFGSEALRGRLAFVPPMATRLPGDLIGMVSGHLDHHLALALPWDKVIHAIEKHGVVIHDIDEIRFARRVLYVLRLMEQ